MDGASNIPGANGGGTPEHEKSAGISLEALERELENAGELTGESRAIMRSLRLADRSGNGQVSRIAGFPRTGF